MANLVPSIPMSIAQNILSQPDQPLADPATLDQATAVAKLPKFFEDTFAALNQQEQARQDQQAQMQQQYEANAASAASVGASAPQPITDQSGLTPADYSEVSDGPINQLPTFGGNAPTQQDQSGAIPPTSETAAASTPSPEQTPTQKAESGGGGGGALGGLWDSVKSVAGDVNDLVAPPHVKDLVTGHPVRFVENVASDIRHPIRAIEDRGSTGLDLLHKTLGLPMQAVEAAPTGQITRNGEELTPLSVFEGNPLDIRWHKSQGTLGEALDQLPAQASIPTRLVLGAGVYGPLTLAAGAIGAPAALVDVLFTGDAIAQTKPILDQYKNGEISGQTAIKDAALTVGPQLAGLVAGHIAGMGKENVGDSAQGAPREIAPGSVPEIAQTRAGETAGALDEVARLKAEAQSITDPGDRQRFMQQHGIIRTPEELAIDHNEMAAPTTTESGAVPVKPEGITERAQTPVDTQQDRHVLEGPNGSVLDYRGTHINDVNAGSVQGQGTGTSLLNTAIDSIRSKSPDATITADLNSEGGARLFAKVPGAAFFSRTGEALTPEEAIASASRREGPTVEVKPTETPAAAAAAAANAAPPENVSSGIEPAPKLPAPENAAPNVPSETSAAAASAPESVPVASQEVIPAISTPAEAKAIPNPVADAVGTPAPRQPQPVGGGTKIMPSTPSLNTLERSLQSSATLNKVIEKVPQVGSVARVVFGSAADKSTEPARLAAAHDALTIAFDNRTEVGLAHVAQAPLRDAFGKDALKSAAQEDRQFTVSFKRSDGATVKMPINDLMEADLSKFNLTKAQRDAIMLRRQVWQEGVGSYNSVLQRLKNVGFRIRGLKENIEDLDSEQLFPRVVLGRVDDAGVLHTGEALSGGNYAGGVKTAASFKGARAGIDVHALPSGDHIEVPSGGRVVEYQGKYHVLTSQDLAKFKEDYPGEPLPDAVKTTRVHEVIDPETKAKTYVPLEPDAHVYKLDDGTHVQMTNTQAREFRKGLTRDQYPQRLESNPYTRTYTTAEMQNRGLRYEDPDTALALKLGEIGRRTADLDLLATTLERNKDILRTKAAIVGPGTRTGVYRIQPGEKFGLPEGSTIDVSKFDEGKIPALKDYYGPTELVREYERRIGEQRTKLIPIATELGNDARGLIASGDVGTIGIQLMGAVANDLGNVTRAALRLAKGDVAGAQRSLSIITGKSIMAKVHTAIEGDAFLSRTLADPKNQGILERWGAYLNPPHQNEFASASAEAGHGLARLPVVGGGFRRLNQMFENALFMSQLEHVRALDAIHGPNISAADREALGSWVRNSVGTLSSRRLGISPMQQDAENTYLLFASRYTRSLFASVGALAKLDKGGTEARLAVGSLFAAGAAGYIGAATALGQKPEFDPMKPGFMALRVGDNWVGVGGGIRAMAHLIATSGDTLFNNPGNFLSPDFTGPRENPILNFWRSRSAPLAGTAMDIFTGEDFRGRPIKWSADWKSILLSHGLPFAGQGALEANGNFFTKVGMGLVTGTGYRASPMTANQLYDLYLKEQKNAATGQQRFPDGSRTVETSTNGFNDFIKNDPQAAHLHEEVTQTRRDGTQTQRDVQAVLDKRQTQLDAAQKAFNTTKDYVKFRHDDTQIRASSADAMKQMALDSTGSTQDRSVITSWYALYKDPSAVDPVTGAINSNGLDALQAQWKVDHPGEFERVIAPSQTVGLTPLETQLRNDRKVIENSGWWKTDDNAWQTLVKNSRAAGIHLPPAANVGEYAKLRLTQLIAQATQQHIAQPELWAQTQLSKDRTIHAFDTIRTRDRLLLQKANPKLTVLLARWGYNNVSQQEYNMAAGQLGNTTAY